VGEGERERYDYDATEEVIPLTKSRQCSLDNDVDGNNCDNKQ